MSMEDNTFVYFEIPADDLERARHFYEELLDWDIISMSEQGFEGFEGYWSVLVSDDFTDMQGGMMERDVLFPQPRFYIGVKSLDESVEKLQELGGSIVMPKTAVGDMGWTVLFEDPEGNVFGLWQTNPATQYEEGEEEAWSSDSEDEEDAEATKHKFVHFEIPANNVQRARKFYQALLGWKIGPMSEQGFTDYLGVMVSDNDSDMNGGMLSRSEEYPAPIFYIGVTSLDQTLEKLRELGGSILTDKKPAQGFGWFASFKDTEGNTFGLWESDSEAR
jgi:uncharacterized protein